MGSTVTDLRANMSPLFEGYEARAARIEQLKSKRAYDRITIHDVNNALGKINNALWLMAREQDSSTPLFRTCQQIVEKELAASLKALAEPEETPT